MKSYLVSPRVLASLVVLTLVTLASHGARSAGGQPPAAADLVVLNGRIVTVDASFSTAEAAAVSGGTIRRGREE